MVILMENLVPHMVFAPNAYQTLQVLLISLNERARWSV
ncbi:hypothetical protein BRADI_4g14232v3 [Brachypodium distachyon]|uniref:Uncharacterized protein n=1 Tax=Brachypodium distachyon TaxID=15368 RepID=A0A2K2CMS6_BRADI|nr:hypothetical protein BRADI_4g14232v3 [Brachypodium distachyon]